MTRRYRPDHNGECLECDEPFDGHDPVTLECLSIGGFLPGQRVRLADAFRQFVAQVTPQLEFEGQPEPVTAWNAHLAEFDGCIGVVLGPMFPGTDSPEIDVRWAPSGLRYGYRPDWLEKVSDESAAE